MASLADGSVPEPANLLNLPSELRLSIYRHLGHHVPQTVEIYPESIWKTSVGEPAKAIASLNRVCKVIHWEIADLLDEVRRATSIWVLIGEKPIERPSPYVENDRLYRQENNDPSWLRKMHSIQLYLWINLTQCPGGDEDLEERHRRQLQIMDRFDLVLDLLRSSSTLEWFNFYVHVAPIGMSIGFSAVGRQLADLENAINSEAKSKGWKHKERELEHASRAAPLLRLGVEDPELLDDFPSLQNGVNSAGSWMPALWEMRFEGTYH